MAKKFGDLFGNMDDVFSVAKISNFDLDDVLSRTRTFTEEVSKKSAEALELSRKKVECLDIKAKLSKAYERYGRLADEAVQLAKTADCAVVYLGLPECFETEGLDRTHMRLPENQIALLKKLRAVCKKIVVVLSCGSAVETDWVQDCDALLYAGLGGEAVALNRKEYELLRVLMENKGKVLSRDRLLTDVWGYDAGETRTLDNHVARLRKLGIKIETVFGVGYKLAAD